MIDKHPAAEAAIPGLKDYRAQRLTFGLALQLLQKSGIRFQEDFHPACPEISEVAFEPRSCLHRDPFTHQRAVRCDDDKAAGRRFTNPAAQALHPGNGLPHPDEFIPAHLRNNERRVRGDSHYFQHGYPPP